MKTCVLVDGFNLFHAIDTNHDYHKYKWLDLKKLALAFLPHTDHLVDVYYFTAYATWDQHKIQRHQIYVHMKLKEHHLSTCQFPEKLPMSQKITLTRPPSWK